MTSIRLHDVSVDLPILNAGSRSLRNNLLSAATGGKIRRGEKKIIVRALDGVSLELTQGTRVGLVGHNGAGKTTLLRVLAGIFEPTGGQVITVGKIAPIFDISFGMDPEISGWDNIILRGILLGLGIDEIRARQQEIAEVSELGEFLDMPLRTYSGGMTTRLAFAVSTSIRADILLIDEGIGAGDAAFFQKAKKLLRTFVEDAGILVLASHSDDLLREWCETAIWLDQGRVRGHGPLEEILRAYHTALAETSDCTYSL
ncbi:MAG: ABC transporter ATP-binding protein [Rhodospirillaceae bacterium]|nr:ABC transporter ATP-binding protein [Rhodospirillaceae bacterium]